MDAFRDTFRKRLTACVMAGSLATALGCGAPSERAPTPAVYVARTDSALDLTGYKSAGQVVCDLLNQLPGGNIGGVNINKPWCQYVNYDDLYYLGSYAWSTIISNGSPPPSKRAPAMADALFCALKDSRGATADGTVHTGLGRFGMASRIEVPKWDVQARQVVGQRIGTLYLFGVGLDIEDQDYVATFPTETANSGFSLHRTGYYMDLQSSKTSWDIGGNGTIPPFSLSLDFGQTGLFQSMQNNAIAFTSKDNNGNPDPTNVANPKLSWDAWVASCNACTPSGVIQCDCPSSADWAQHNAFAGWTGDQYKNLGDAKLPYVSPTGGVSGNFVYRNSSLNWTQFGNADGGTVAGDPVHTGGHSPTTHLGFTFALDYDIIDLSLNLAVGFRSGMELTQGDYNTQEFLHWASVGTSVDAESNVGLDARLVIRNPFPFGPDNLVDETFTILDPAKVSQRQHTVAARIGYDFANGFPFGEYMTAATGDQTNGQAAHDACLAVPPANNPPVQPGSPTGLLQQAADAAQTQLFPCHVHLCRPDSASSPTGTPETCEWNKQTKKLDCVSATGSCYVCNGNYADLCDAAGNTYSAKTITPTQHCIVN